MGILKRFIDNYKEKKQKEKDLEETLRIEKHVAEKMKNADDRELERYMEEMRQERVSKQLEVLRKRKAEKIWKSNPFTHNKNLFKNKCMFKVRSS